MAAMSGPCQHRSMKRSPIVVAALALTLAAAAAPATGRISATLQLNGVLDVKVHPVDCPAGTPTTSGCYLNTGVGVIEGLGPATETYTVIADLSTSCAHVTFFGVVIAVAGKGEIDAALTDPYSCDPPPSATATTPFTITGGSGAYAGATGSGSVVTGPFNESSPGTGTDTDTWTGPLTVSGLDFDTTPPTIAGATNRAVTTKSRAGAHLHYTLTATDTVDGSLPVSCQPRSGFLFPLGRTPVTCTATDMSGNTATKRFTVTVKRARH